MRLDEMTPAQLSALAEYAAVNMVLDALERGTPVRQVGFAAWPVRYDELERLYARFRTIRDALARNADAPQPARLRVDAHGGP